MPKIDFTPEELNCLYDAVGTYISDYEGPETDSELLPFRLMEQRLERELWVGKEVRFEFKNETLVGTLTTYIDTVFSARVAHINRQGCLYGVAATAVLGLA